MSAGGQGIPLARGSRVAFGALPDVVRAWIADAAGGAVRGWHDHGGGFSPGAAATVETDAGRVFAKAVSAEANPDTPGMHRREAEILAALGPTAVRAPQLITSGEVGPWAVVMTEVLDGANPDLPWTPSGVAALLAALDELAEVGDPAPIDDLGGVVEHLSGALGGWTTMAGGDVPDDLDPWAVTRLDLLADIEAGWSHAAAGSGLLHADVRGDNLVVAPDGTATLVDWPWAVRGNPLLDVVAAAPSVAMQGGPPCGELVARSAAGRGADPEAVRSLAVAFAGYFLEHASRPPPPGLASVRAFQRAQGDVALAWLRDLID